MVSKNYDVLNFLIQKFNFKSYLEIGVRGYQTFDKISCEKKVAVDPAPNGFRSGKGIEVHRKFSNDFFNELKDSDTFDLIFIDGDHSYEAVKSDLENAIKFLNKDGLIVLHDVDPPAEKWQGVPRLSDGPGSRNLASPLGECWRALVTRRIVNKDILVFTVKCAEEEFGVEKKIPGSGCETGLAICKIIPNSFDKSLQQFENLKVDWNLLENNREVLLNRHSMEDFYQKVELFFKEKANSRL